MMKTKGKDCDVMRISIDLLLPEVLDLVPAFLARLSHYLHALLEQSLQLLRPLLHLLLETPHFSSTEN